MPAAAREAGVVAVAAAVYGGVRAVTEGSVAAAVENGRSILRLEEELGLAWEQAAQADVLGMRALVTVANWIYIWGHWPVLITCGIVLFLRRRDSYLLLRRAMVLSGMLGFAFFAFFPAAPPRLLPGFVDTVAEQSRSYRALQPPALTNQYAAFPSLHFGWNLLLGIVLFLTFTHVAVRLFAVAMPAAMAFAVVATGNHFVLDVAAGGILVLAALAAVLTLTATLGVADAAPPLRDRPPRRERAPGTAARRRPGPDLRRG